METFKAKLLFRIDIQGEEIPQYDEQHLLIQAYSPAKAYDAALKRAAREEETFKNSLGKNISWNFIGITELQAVCFDDGIWQTSGRTYQPEQSDLFEKHFTKEAQKLAQHYLYSVKS